LQKWPVNACIIQGNPSAFNRSDRRTSEKNGVFFQVRTEGLTVIARTSVDAVKLADRWIKEGREVHVYDMDGRSIDLASLRALHPPEPS
jgi:hypothetical protein